MINYCIIFPYIAVPLEIYFQIDPLGQLESQILTNSNPLFAQLIILISRILTVVAGIQTSRLIAKMVSICTILTQLILDCITNLGKMTTRLVQTWIRTNPVLREYTCLEIILFEFLEIASNVIFLLMGQGILLLVMFNFITLKLYGHVPSALYPAAPSVSILLPIVIQTLLQMLIDVFEDASRLKNRWDKELGDFGGVKYLKRRLRAVRILRWYAGIFSFKLYDLKQQVKPIYYYTIVNYTITALLSIELPRNVK